MPAWGRLLIEQKVTLYYSLQEPESSSGIKALSKMMWSEKTNLKQTNFWLKALRGRIWRKGIILYYTEYKVSVQLSEFGESGHPPHPLPQANVSPP